MCAGSSHVKAVPAVFSLYLWHYATSSCTCEEKKKKDGHQETAGKLYIEFNRIQYFLLW